MNIPDLNIKTTLSEEEAKILLARLETGHSKEIDVTEQTNSIKSSTK